MTTINSHRHILLNTAVFGAPFLSLLSAAVFFGTEPTIHMKVGAMCFYLLFLGYLAIVGIGGSSLNEEEYDTAKNYYRWFAIILTIIIIETWVIVSFAPY